MSRVLRAEIEAAQARTKSVRAQLEHRARPKFIADREALEAEIMPLREQVRAVEERSAFLEREAVERESVLEYTVAVQRGAHASQNASAFAAVMAVLGLIAVFMAVSTAYDVMTSSPSLVIAASTLAAIVLGAVAGRRIWLWRAR